MKVSLLRRAAESGRVRPRLPPDVIRDLEEALGPGTVCRHCGRWNPLNVDASVIHDRGCFRHMLQEDADATPLAWSRDHALD